MHRSLVIHFSFLLLAAVAWGPISARAAERPNLIYIMLDDAGYGDLSCYGQQKFQTPNIDRLAAQGLKFTDHYSGSTVCAPTRCSLMTGLHTGHALIRGNREVQPEGQAPMPADVVTLPRLLRQAGYVTGAFGKWGLGAPGSASDPADHFDLFFGYNCQREAHTYYPTHLWRNKIKVKLDGQTYSHDVIQAEALKFIRDHRDRPFFCYLPITIPHAAMHAPESAVAPFRKKFPQFEDKIGKYRGPQVKNPIAAFAGMMTYMDQGIGEVMALLDELEIDEKTLVLFTSDNGPHLEGGHDPRFFDSNGPLRGFKRDLYEGGIRVPLIARWPGRIKPGSTTNHVCAHWDVLPTFCELAQAETPREIDGISMVPTLLGNHAEQQRHAYLYWEFHSRGGSQAVRLGSWKGVRNKAAKVRDAPIELYDLASDLGETTDVAGEHPEIVQRIEQAMAEAHVASPVFSMFD